MSQVGHYKTSIDDRQRLKEQFVAAKDFTAELAKFCKEQGRTVTYSHRTERCGGKGGAVTHKVIASVQVPQSLSKPKKEESPWCAREPEARQVAAKQMLERLVATQRKRCWCWKR
jgi:hypothetical protein